MSTPPPTYYYPAPAKRRLFVTAAAGAVLGALVVGAVWTGLATRGGNRSQAGTDAAASCDLFDRLPGSWQASMLEESNIDRIGAAVALADAAGRGDVRYGALAGQAKQVQQSVLTFDVAGLGAQIKATRKSCQSL